MSSRRWTRGMTVICALGTTLALAACGSGGGSGSGTVGSTSGSSASGQQAPASNSGSTSGSSGAASGSESSGGSGGSESAGASQSAGSPAPSSGAEQASDSTPGLEECGGGSGGDDIVLGGLFTKTPFPFGNDAEKTMKQVVKDCNQAGGINGHTIKYVSGDDGGDVTKTGALARKNVDSGSIAMVGSASFTACGANRQYYHDHDIIALQAVGVDPFCFTSPNIFSVTVSPFSQVTLDLYYASETLKDSKICFFQPVTPGTTKAIEKAIKTWHDITGKKLTIDDHKIPTDQTKFTTELARAKDANCDAIVYGGGDQVAASMLKNAKNQGMTDVDFLYVSVSYTSQLAKSAGKLGMKVYATTGLFPYTSMDPRTDPWRKVAKAGGAEQTAFSEAAYIAGNWALHELAQIDGKITKASFAKQLDSDTEGYKSPLVSVPLVFTKGKAHDRTSGIEMVQLTNGKWQKVAEIALPKS